MAREESTDQRDERISGFLAPAEEDSNREMFLVLELISALSGKWKITPKAIVQMMEAAAIEDEEVLESWIEIIRDDPPGPEGPEQFALLGTELVAFINTRDLSVTWAPANEYVQARLEDQEGN